MRSNRTRLAGIVVLVASAASGIGCSHEPTTTTTTTAAPVPTNEERESAVEELNDAAETLAGMNVPALVPQSRLAETKCAIVVPSLVKGAFIVGAQHGRGVVTCRTNEGWSGPVFVTVSGGSGGLQAGYQSSDVLMLVTSERGMTKLFTEGFKLGAGMSAAAGPVGKEKTAATSSRMNAEVLTYARSKGLFAGVDLNGASIKHDHSRIAALYGSSADAHAILDGRVRAPAEARQFLAQVKSIFPTTSRPLAQE